MGYRNTIAQFIGIKKYLFIPKNIETQISWASFSKKNAVNYTATTVIISSFRKNNKAKEKINALKTPKERKISHLFHYFTPKCIL